MCVKPHQTDAVCLVPATWEFWLFSVLYKVTVMWPFINDNDSPAEHNTQTWQRRIQVGNPLIITSYGYNNICMENALESVLVSFLLLAVEHHTWMIDSTDTDVGQTAPPAYHGLCASLCYPYVSVLTLCLLVTSTCVPSITTNNSSPHKNLNQNPTLQDINITSPHKNLNHKPILELH